MIIYILLAFSIVGFLDLVFDLKLGLKDDFQKGLSSFGSLSLSMLGILTVGVVFIESHIEPILQFTSHFTFDASLLFSALIAPDMGGYTISQEIAASKEILIMNGVLLSSILGQLISFQIPVFANMLPQKEHRLMFQSMIAGIAVIPLGLLCGSLMIGLDFQTLFRHWLPIFLFCGLISVLMIVASKIIIKVLLGFASLIQYLTYFLFLIAVVGFIFPQFAYVKVDLLADTMLVIFRICLIVSGSLVLSNLILRYCKKPIEKVANLLGINDIAMVGLILNMATSLAMLPLYEKMNKKGKMVNAAFSVSGAYLLGGQLAFIGSVQGGNVIFIYLITKLICGIFSIIGVELLEKRIDTL